MWSTGRCMPGFDSMDTKDVVTWNVLIVGYVEQGLSQDSLVLCGPMEQEGLVFADLVALACLLKACAPTGPLQRGRQLRSQIVDGGLLDVVVLGTCLADLYAKCGQLEGARQIFDSVSTKNLVKWDALMAGCCTRDEGHKARACFRNMFAAGTTFTGFLAACSHEEPEHEDFKHFNSMADHGMRPTIERHSCMIDLLGRADHLDEAENMLLSILWGWTSLLSSCKCRGCREATGCFESLVRLEPHSPSPHVLMANAHADAGRCNDVEKTKAQRMVVGANKKPAVWTIEVKQQVHRFVVGETRLKAESMSTRLKQEGGHVPDTKLVLKPCGEKRKEEMCFAGVLREASSAVWSLERSELHTFNGNQDLRMCGDSHRYEVQG